MHLSWPYGKHQAWQQGYWAESCCVARTAMVEKPPFPWGPPQFCSLLGSLAISLCLLKANKTRQNLLITTSQHRSILAQPWDYLWSLWQHQGKGKLRVQKTTITSWPHCWVEPSTGPILICSFSNHSGLLPSRRAHWGWERSFCASCVLDKSHSSPSNSTIQCFYASRNLLIFWHPQPPGPSYCFLPKFNLSKKPITSDIFLRNPFLAPYLPTSPPI